MWTDRPIKTRIVGRIFIASVSCLFVVLMNQNCGRGFYLAEEFSNRDLASLDPSVKLTCTSDQVRGTTEVGLTRLSQLELTNSLSDIFGSDVVSSLGTFSALPIDTIESSVSEFNKMFSKEHAETLFNTSLELAAAVFDNPSYLSRIAPNCVGNSLSSNSISEACLDEWIQEFGLKLHRRPIPSEKLSEYKAIIQATELKDLPLKLRLEALLAHLLQAPEFLFHWTELEDGAIRNGRSRVDQFTVASRLSYRLTDSTPDDALLEAAANGELSNIETLRQHGERLLSSEKGRAKVRNMVNHWLHLDEVPVPSAVALSRFNLDSSNATRSRLRNELVEEVLEFTEEIIFNQNGSYRNLMTSTLAFPRSAEAAKIFGTAIATDKPVHAPNGRMGLATRPGLLLSGVDRESPVFRGVAVRNRILCENIPPPPANADGEIADAVSGVDLAEFSMRENTKKITEVGSCIGCHSFINPLGYALGSFGPLGEYRTEELTYTDSGDVKKSFPIDTEVSGAGIIGQNDFISGHEDLAKLIAQSGKGQSCFARYVFRWSRLRVEETADGCALNDSIEVISSERPLKEAIVYNIASEDIYWKKR